MSLEITEQDYLLWRHHPVSEVFLRYLRDYREALHRTAMADWESGAITLTQEQEMRGRSLTLAEVAELPFAAIENFYKEDNASD